MELIDFIIKAKLDGYAAGGEGEEISFDGGYRGFKYANATFSYLDRYTGFNPFSGTETVFRVAGNQPIWIMNYFGKADLPSSELALLYSFLKEAMQLIDHSFPFRGPELFLKNGWRYKNRQNGDLKVFHGTEEVYFEGQKVYELFYHGGVPTG
ncbi:hypothetical protein KJ966_18025 [bacterium]|nr:hypothetical protein [bacterium]